MTRSACVSIFRELVKTKALKKKKPVKKKAGGDLFHQVVRLTGIPKQALLKELKGILDKQHIDVSSLTLEELRCAAASYLREIMGGILDKYHPKREESLH